MKLTSTEFMNLSKSHKSADDHLTLADHFSEHATEHENDAKMLEDLAALHDKTDPALAGEERHYAAHSREAAEAMRNLARIHQTLAQEHLVAPKEPSHHIAA